jgi:hypothetical protein
VKRPPNFCRICGCRVLDAPVFNGLCERHEHLRFAPPAVNTGGLSDVELADQRAEAARQQRPRPVLPVADGE